MVPTQAIFPIDFTCKMTSRFSQNLYSGAILKVKILGFHHGPLQKICVALLLSDPCRGVLSSDVLHNMRMCIASFVKMVL